MAFVAGCGVTERGLRSASPGPPDAGNLKSLEGLALQLGTLAHTKNKGFHSLSFSGEHEMTI